MKLNKLLAITLLAGCVSASVFATDKHTHSPNSTQHTHEHKKTEISHAQEYSYAYTANYKLAKGEYYLELGHTHEREFKFAFIKLVSDNSTVTQGNAIFGSHPLKVKHRQNLDLQLGKLYEIKLEHNKTFVRINILQDGIYTFFADTPPGEALPYNLTNADGNDIAPVYSNVVSNLKNEIYKGHFVDTMVKDRALSDWEGVWQSVYPYFADGSLDVVYQERAKKGGMTFDEYKSYYEIGYKTDINKIAIKGNQITWYTGNQSVTGTYEYDGYKILNYSKGNRGVRYLFKNVDQESAAPKYMQFSDHNIFPVKSNHFHLFYGNSSQEQVLKELERWPTYYPSSYSKEQIIEDLLAH